MNIKKEILIKIIELIMKILEITVEHFQKTEKAE